MNWKRILGIIVVVLGIACIFFSNYITDQVNEGKGQIKSAQKKVDTGTGILSLSPYTKDVGEKLSDSAQKKIDEGKAQVTYYEGIAGQLQVGGIVLIIAGAVLIIIGRRKK